MRPDVRETGADLPEGDGTAADAIGSRIERLGPIPFADFVELALYGPGGFFTARGGAGRRADFITSPEVGPLFGAVVARAVDAEWHRLGEPDPFVVVEAGAGRGALARSVLAAAPKCAGALRYVAVERSPTSQEAMRATLPVEPAANVLGSPHAGDDDADHEGAGGAPGGGPVLTVLDALPAVAVPGVVLANELLDNLPFGLAERTDAGWAEVRVAAGGGDGFEEVLVPAPPALAATADRLAPGADPGARIPLQPAAGAWLRSAVELLVRGRVIAVDYAATTPELARRPPAEWLRTYRGHERGDHPLVDPGSQDITCEVAVDQLARVRPPDADTAQADWLAAHGLGELVAEARATWHERAHLGDLTAMKARSRVGEADALTDPGGLGAFRVLEWVVGR